MDFLLDCSTNVLKERMTLGTMKSLATKKFRCNRFLRIFSIAATTISSSVTTIATQSNNHPSFAMFPRQQLSTAANHLFSSKLGAEKSNNHLKSTNKTKKNYELRKRNPYDVHVYYTIPDQQEEALKLREKMNVEFPWMRFYQPRNRPIGPHPIPMFEADFGQYENSIHLDKVCEFLEKEHGNLSVLIHPHSTDGAYADHTRNAIWFGSTLNLRL